MSVFPQLMVLATPNDQEKLRAVIAHVINSFGDFNFHRIQSQGNNYEIFVEGRSIANYLKEELRRLFRHTNLQPEVFDLIKSPPTNG
jgi:hypothetical protein